VCTTKEPRGENDQKPRWFLAIVERATPLRDLPISSQNAKTQQSTIENTRFSGAALRRTIQGAEACEGRHLWSDWSRSATAADRNSGNERTNRTPLLPRLFGAASALENRNYTVVPVFGTKQL
jgi:hypothetical protein